MNTLLRITLSAAFLFTFIDDARSENCMSSGKALLLNPFQYQLSERGYGNLYIDEYEHLINSKLFKPEDIEYFENDKANLKAFERIKSGRYSYIHISTHGAPNGKICTSEKINGANWYLFNDGGNIKASNDKVYSIDRMDGREVLCLRSGWWENVNLDKKSLIISSCNVLKSMYRSSYNEFKINPILSIFYKSDPGVIIGHNDFVVVPFGDTFVSKYLLNENSGDALNKSIDVSSAISKAKSDYFEIRDSISAILPTVLNNTTAGESAKYINGNNFFLNCKNEPPEVSITNPADGSTFTKGKGGIEFKSVASDADGTISSYSWEISSYTWERDSPELVAEGAMEYEFGTVQNKEILINAADTYKILLTVTDNDGATGTDSITVTVIEAPVDVTGSWTGAADFAPNVTASLTQSGSKLSGTINVGLKCFESGTVAGTIDGKSINMGVTSSDNSVMEYSGTIENNDSMSGTWSQISGTCPVPNGNWTLGR